MGRVGVVVVVATALFALATLAVSSRGDGVGGVKVLAERGSRRADQADALAIQRDGKLVAAGTGLARYTARGELDPSFGRGGKVVTDIGLRSDAFGGGAIQREGKIVAAGRGFVGDQGVEGFEPSSQNFDTRLRKRWENEERHTLR
jgi:hypothetical protein